MSASLSQRWQGFRVARAGQGIRRSWAPCRLRRVRRRPSGRGISPEPEYRSAPDASRRDVALELGLGHAGRLEVELVEHRVVGLGHQGRRTRGAAGQERHAEADDSAHAVGTQQRGMPGDRRAPVVAGHHGRLRAEGVDQPDDIADQVQEGVLRRWPRGGRSGRSRACRARRRGSRPRPAPAAGAATSTRTRGSRGRAPPAVPCPARRRGCGSRSPRRIDG